jgi:AraC-like DNA-binding protein
MHRPSPATRESDHATMSRIPSLCDVQMLQARYHAHSFAPHSHASFVVGAVERGSAHFRAPGLQGRLNAGDVLLIAPEVIHSANPAGAEGWSYRAIYPDADVLGAIVGRDAEARLRATRCFVIVGGHLASGIQVALKHLVWETNGFRSEGLFVEVVRSLLRGSRDLGMKRAFADEVPDSVLRAREYIRTHPRDRMSLGDVARQAGLSPFQLVRAFGRAYGITPYAYFAQYRVREARRLLEHGQSPTDVARNAGFSDLSHLTRHFKRVVGVTPGAYADGVGRGRQLRPTAISLVG